MRTRPPLEKVVQSRIAKALRDLGFTVNDLTQPRRTMMPLGLPDLYVRHPRFGRFWVEVKRPGEKPRPTQLAWHEDERACGGTVIVATSVADVLDGLRAAGVPILELEVE